MQNTLISFEDFQKKMRTIKSPGDMQTFLQELTVSIPTPAPAEAHVGKGRGRWRRTPATVPEEQQPASSKLSVSKETKFKPLPGR
jgi:hypothetical protein